MHSLHFMRPVLNSSDINYAGKLFFFKFIWFFLKKTNLLWQSAPSVPALMGCWLRYLLTGIPDGRCFSMPEGPPRVENIGPS